MVEYGDKAVDIAVFIYVVFEYGTNEVFIKLYTYALVSPDVIPDIWLVIIVETCDVVL